MTEKKAAPKKPAKQDEPEKGLADLSIEQNDGATAVFKLGKEERVVDQADLHNLAKKVSAGIQVTY